jgi:hypothetical protein
MVLLYLILFIIGSPPLPTPIMQFTLLVPPNQLHPRFCKCFYCFPTRRENRKGNQWCSCAQLKIAIVSLTLNKTEQQLVRSPRFLRLFVSTFPPPPFWRERKRKNTPPSPQLLLFFSHFFGPGRYLRWYAQSG